MFFKKVKDVSLEEDGAEISFAITTLSTSNDLDLANKISTNTCKNITRTNHWGHMQFMNWLALRFWIK